MSVNVLTKEQKDAVVTIYKSKTKTIKEMAKWLNVSTRTIGRVIVEAGLATPVPRLKGEAHAALKVLQKHNITPEKLDFALSVATQVEEKPHEPTRADIVQACCTMEEGTWAAILADIVHIREAQKQGTNVMTAMNRLRNKMESAGNKNHG